jgi:cysteinyl-tRNA synthetase
MELPASAAALLAAREKARSARHFTESDRLRTELATQGIVVTDTPEGQRWKTSVRKEIKGGH